MSPSSSAASATGAAPGTTASSATRATRRPRPPAFPPEYLHKAKAWFTTGMSTETGKAQARHHFDLPEEDYPHFLQQVDALFAERGESFDPLAMLMRRLCLRETLVERMMVASTKETKPASYFNTIRLLLNDSDRAMHDICSYREKQNRDEHDKARRADEIRTEKTQAAAQHFALQKMYENQGYSYEPSENMLAPGHRLSMVAAFTRDLLRMRMLPKSAREDAYLMQACGLIDPEDPATLDPKTLSDEKIQPNFRLHDPEYYVRDPQEQHDQSPEHARTAQLLQALKAARVHTYNEIWEMANKQVDGIMEAFGIKLGFVHETLGVPTIVRKALDGDAEAIRTLREAVAEIRRKQEAEEAAGRGRPLPVLQRRLSETIDQYLPQVVACLVGWLIFSLTLGPIGLARLQAEATACIPVELASGGATACKVGQAWHLADACALAEPTRIPPFNIPVELASTEHEHRLDADLYSFHATGLCSFHPTGLCSFHATGLFSRPFSQGSAGFG